MELIELLPDYYLNSPEVEELQKAFQYWTNALKLAKDDLFLQLNVNYATWGLSIWETALGISTDVSKPYEYRRTRVVSKLRGSGTTTANMIKNVAESFTNGQIEVIERNSENSFEVKFTDIIGIPPNLDDLEAALELIKPAHLALIYAYSYLLIKDIEGVMTLGDLETQTLDKFAF